MGLQIAEIVPKQEISLSDLKGKTIAVDAFNILYQFLTTIRQHDGTPLMDSKGRITSHLSGLFYRTVNLLTQDIHPIFVFDGAPPGLKKLTNKSREEAKQEAMLKYKEAVEKGSEEEMGKYARQTTRLTQDMIDESKKLLEALGVPVVQAPSEGEAQAAYMARVNEKIYAASSQDYDSILFQAPKLIQNLTLARKRKTSSGSYVPIQPELIELDKVLNTLQINHEQLICLGILVGTDYNPGGYKGIGPKKALIIVRQYKQPALIFQALEKNPAYQDIEFNWQDIFHEFKQPQVTKAYSIKFSDADSEKLARILHEEHDFSLERIDSSIDKLNALKAEKKQSALDKWF